MQPRHLTTHCSGLAPLRRLHAELLGHSPLNSGVRPRRAECAACYPVIELSRSASGAMLNEEYDWRNYVENACGAGYSPEWTF